MVRLTHESVMLARQCPKRLHLEVRAPELGGSQDRGSEVLIERARVLALAHRVLCDDLGREVGADLPEDQACARSLELVGEDSPLPILSGAFQAGGIHMRADILRPVAGRWHLIHVIPDSSVRRYHVEDLALQWWILRDSGVPLDRVIAAAVDTSFVYSGGGDYSGLFRLRDVTADVLKVRSEAGDWVTIAEDAADSIAPIVMAGEHCVDPEPCPFREHCWGGHTQHPILSLGGRPEVLEALVAEGFTDVREVPENRLVGSTQRRIASSARKGERWVGDGLHTWAAALSEPLTYLHFDTGRFAVPLWKGTRPFEEVAFSFACMAESDGGSVCETYHVHRTPDAPHSSLAEALLEAVGPEGPIVVFSNRPARVIRQLVRRVSDLSRQLTELIPRLRDLRAPFRAHYYHSTMRGRWTVDSIWPTILPGVEEREIRTVLDRVSVARDYAEALKSRTDPLERDLIWEGVKARGGLRLYILRDLMRFVRNCRVGRGWSAERGAANRGTIEPANRMPNSRD